MYKYKKNNKQWFRPGKPKPASFYPHDKAPGGNILEPNVEEEAACISWRDEDEADCISWWEDASIVEEDNAAREDEENEAACTWLSFLEDEVNEEADEAACIWLSFLDDASKEDEDEAIWVEDAA